MLIIMIIYILLFIIGIILGLFIGLFIGNVGKYNFYQEGFIDGYSKGKEK